MALAMIRDCAPHQVQHRFRFRVAVYLSTGLLRNSPNYGLTLGSARRLMTPISAVKPNFKAAVPTFEYELSAFVPEGPGPRFGIRARHERRL